MNNPKFSDGTPIFPMRVKTDLELTEKCAKWLGYEVQENLTSLVRINDKNLWSNFDPLHNWTDLMTKVVPKLPEDYVTQIGGTYFEIVNETIDEMEPIKAGKFPDDLPRTILELIAELYEKEKNHDT